MGPWLTASEVPRRLHKYEQSVVSGRQKVKLFTGNVGLHLTTFSSSPSQTQVASLQFGFKKQCKVKSLPCTSRRDGRLCPAWQLSPPEGAQLPHTSHGQAAPYGLCPETGFALHAVSSTKAADSRLIYSSPKGYNLTSKTQIAPAGVCTG